MVDSLDSRAIGRRVREVREAASPKVSQDQAAQALGISQPSYSRIETGERSLKGDELIMLADLFRVRAGAILGVAEVRQRARFAARTGGSPAPMAAMRDRLCAYLELDDYLTGQGGARTAPRLPSGTSPHPVEGPRRPWPAGAITSNEQRAAALAGQVRARHSLGDLPIQDMFEFVHAATGIDVLSMAAGEAEHGLSASDPATGAIVIAVATTSHPMRQRSSIAHELGHALADDLGSPQPARPGERSPAEIRADAFARHLLLPLGSVRHRAGMLSGGQWQQNLSLLVQEFGVSPRLAAIQVRQAQLIDNGTCDRWGAMTTGQLAARCGWLSQYRSLVEDSRRPRAPQALMSRAVDGYCQGVLGLAELATWYGDEPAKLAAAIGDREPEQAAADVEDDFWAPLPNAPDGYQ